MSQLETKNHEVEVFFDGGCPLCRREIDLIRRWDRRHRVLFTDIDDPDFRPEDVGRTRDELMARMRGRLADGTWIEGVEVFRRMYAAVGLGPLVWISRWPLISHLLDFGYSVFARHRLSLTGRRCSAGTCSVHRVGEDAVERASPARDDASGAQSPCDEPTPDRSERVNAGG